MDVHRVRASVHGRASRFRDRSRIARGCRVNPVAIQGGLQENRRLHQSSIRDCDLSCLPITRRACNLHDGYARCVRRAAPWLLSFHPMTRQQLRHIALVVRDYDEALAFFCGKLKFTLVEDTYQPEQDKRWVVVAPPGSTGMSLLLARASKPEQEPFIGRQSGGRVFLFLSTDDFWRDYNAMIAQGIKFIREPQQQPYGTVAVFEDLYGNLWDLVQRSHSSTRVETSTPPNTPAPIGPYSHIAKVGQFIT